MGFRPQWYDQEGGSSWRPLGGGVRSWSGIKLILIGTFAVFGLQLLLGGLIGRTAAGLDPLSHWLALRTWTGSPLDPEFNFLFPIQVFTYIFLHDPNSLAHVGFNMLFVWWFGTELEQHLGKAGFLRLYLLGGVFGGLCQWAWGLWTGSMAPTVGASGSVYTVMVLFALLWPRRTIIIFPIFIPVPVIFVIAFKIAGDLFGFMHGAGNVAHLVHLGGAAIGFLWFKQGDVLSRWSSGHQRKKAERVVAHASDDRREMDRILAKIQSSGLASLSTSERGFLDRRSKELRRQGR